ncbi:transposase [Meiothermus granaticius]|uniref:Transposase DDE domain protein n=1 Tax=Meiothermus granaticius NBRC 107808 TaxID=1227551 RepID=A0A399FCP1_9DEIN|nr:transposase [Meiothermus granaticius]MBI5813065.1 transposase [Allomeiothermus silvanus]MCL6526408.1 transposase [Thermaceae bacterium]RIH93495.1 Transposase DDE domain protein [Meiothermus granaticius NBRC 107808]GEM85990.1 transposase [Meiothermus granaticius NBRC 107808]
MTEAQGIPISLAVYPASTHESQVIEAVLSCIRIPQPGRKPRKRIRVLAMDKAFDSTPLRRRLRARGIRASVPERQYQHRRRRGPKLHPASTQRYQVERLHAWMDNYRALVMRYERKAENYRGLLVFAALLICIRVLLHW